MYIVVSQIHAEARIEEEKEKQLVAQSMAVSMKHGRVWDRTSRQDYLRSSEWQSGRERRRMEREVYYARNELTDGRKLQLLSQRLTHEKLPV